MDGTLGKGHTPDVAAPVGTSGLRDASSGRITQGIHRMGIMARHGRFSGRNAAINATLLAGLLSIAVATPAMASSVTTDPRWLPWIGCWVPTTATTDVAASFAPTQRVCVVPAEGTQVVDLITLADGRVVSRVRIDATGERRPVSREGCEGWETARWSAAGGRVFLRSELTCAGAIERVSTGVIAIASPSDWVDVEVLTVRDQRATRIVRYRSASDTTPLDREIATALAGQEMARRAARMGAASLPTIADVIEASSHLEPAAVEAWLLQRMPRFTVEARELRQLAAARVPGSVIDLVVALSQPEMFLDRLSTRGYTLVRIEAPRTRVVAVESPTPTDELVAALTIPGGSIGYGHYDQLNSGRCYRCSWPGGYYYDPTPNSPYGYYPYYPSYPSYPYGYYPVYPYPPAQQPQPQPRPPVIVNGPSYPRPGPSQPPPPAPEPVNGRAINGTGYTRSSGGSAEPTPPPAQRTAPTEAKPRPTAEPKPPPPPAPTSEPKPEPPARTAKPRPPAGG